MELKLSSFLGSAETPVCTCKNSNQSI